MASQFPSEIFTMRDIVSVILLLFLIICRLKNTEPNNNPRSPVCSIMDIHPIIQIPVHCHIHLQNQIDPTITLSVPPRYGIVSTYDIRRREELCEILIKTSKKVFNKFPPMSLMACTPTSDIWLMSPLDMSPQNIETVPIHTGIDKIRSRPVP